MAPRKGKAAKRNPKPDSKPKRAPAYPKQSASTAQKRSTQGSSSVPTIPYTSLAARKRRQPTCSMESLRNLENEVTVEENFIGLFGAHSDNHYTWGKTEAKPIAAIRRKGAKGPRLRMKDIAGLPRGLFPFLDVGSPEPTIPNSPNRSPFLRLPLEIREKIYAFFLIYKRPIIVQHDWEIVEHKQYRNNAIIYVCKQINAEASFFLYRNNAFRTILRPPPSSFYYRDTFAIPAQFVPLFKNVIITCERENYHLEWFEKACASVKKLSDAKVTLDSLTLVTFPQRVGMSNTAIGMEAHPVTFADFFYEKGQLMEELKNLKCKVFNVVVKKFDGEDNRWRLVISLDLRYLNAGAVEEGKLANKETLKLAQSRAEAVEKELRGLKGRFEEVFEDDEGARMEGKCRLLDEDEIYDNGFALARRK